MKFQFFVSIAAALCLSANVGAAAFDNVAPMSDTDGNPVNCHGGGILKVDSVYYWYGEHRPGHEANYQKGVSCYSTTDLVNWKNEGIVFEKVDDPSSEIQKHCTIERPKVVYCPKTGKYVLWFHHELAGRGYEAARCAVAESDTPVGPFKLKWSGRVNPGVYPMNMEPRQVKGIVPDEWWTEEWFKLVDKGVFVERDIDGGQMSRDMTVFVDDDGKAYHVYSSEENLTLQIAELNDDYNAHTGKYIRIFPGGHNEAPVVFKHGGKYWMVTSGCTGWAPNKARMMWADDMLGEWHMVEGKTPCIGPDAELTFGGQGTYCAEMGGNLVFMADKWTPKCLAGSGSLWLPILFDREGTPVIPFVTKW